MDARRVSEVGACGCPSSALDAVPGQPRPDFDVADHVALPTALERTLLNRFAAMVRRANRSPSVRARSLGLAHPPSFDRTTLLDQALTPDLPHKGHAETLAYLRELRDGKPRVKQGADQDPEAPPAFWAVGGAGVGSGGDPIAWFGLNAVQAYFGEDGRDTEESNIRYGAGREVLRDCRSLGADVLRHPGSRDLDWSGLTLSRTTPIPMRYSRVRAKVNNADNVARFSEMLEDLWRTGRQVVYKFFSGGGGAERGRVSSTYRNAIKVRWGDGHDPYRVTSSEFLDLRLSYDLTYLAEIASGVVELLVAVEEEVRRRVGADFTLESVIWGIELFNEIDICNTIFPDGEEPSAMESAEDWAIAYSTLADRFEQEFTSRGRSVPPLLLPGISSYGEDETDDEGSRKTTADWQWRMDFTLWFLTFLGMDLGVTSDRAVNLDYHWYHRRVGDTRHIAVLIAEVHKLRSFLDSLGFEETSITVFEGGVAMGGGDPDGPATAAYFPAWCTDTPTREAFQAYEVMRRLSGILASGAVVASWHSWMSHAHGNFGKMGLRKDGAGVITPEQALQRPAWFAFTRITSLLANCYGAALILPDLQWVDEGGDLVDNTDFEATPDQDALAFEFDAILQVTGPTGLPVRRYVYIVLLDPWQGTREKCVEATLADSKTGTGECDEWDSMPDSTVGIDPGDATENLPYDEPAYAAPRSRPVPSQYRIGSSDPPRIFVSATRLSWRVVACPPGAPALGQEPEKNADPTDPVLGGV